MNLVLRTLKKRLKYRTKLLLAPILYRHRPIGLSACKLSLYLNTLAVTSNLKGAVVEVGCHLCGTAALGADMLAQLGSQREYLAIDTFSGFPEAQFQQDNYQNRKSAEGFSTNGLSLVRKILEMHRATQVRLLQADIVELDESELPERISMALLDTDLYAPIQASLEKVYPRLEPGGVILVDDCAHNGWRAEQAYQDFCRAHAIQPTLSFGMGVISKSRTGDASSQPA